jgi:hypothetical protein
VPVEPLLTARDLFRVTRTEAEAEASVFRCDMDFGVVGRFFRHEKHFEDIAEFPSILLVGTRKVPCVIVAHFGQNPQISGTPCHAGGGRPEAGFLGREPGLPERDRCGHPEAKRERLGE